MNIGLTKNETTPVLIVGGGPAGLLASILFTRLDINHILIEQRTNPQPAPAAHVINTRTMEILRSAGIKTKDFYALDKHADAKYVTWSLGPQHSTIGKFSFTEDEGHLLARINASPEHVTNISQNLFESALLKIASSKSCHHIRFGHTWESFIDGDTQHMQIRDESGECYEIKADYLLAADGASGGISRALDIKKIGPGSLATFLNLSCEVDLTKITREKNSLLYWCLHPLTPGILIVHDPKKQTVYMRPIFDAYESIEDYDDARCEEILKTIFGEKVPMKISFKGIWKMTAQVAERFAKGNVFLVGDSAHRFPPTGGLGLNSGAGDVHNLVWKIAACLKNGVHESLLLSYEEERKPVAQQNCDTSARNFHKMTEVTDALGLDSSKAHIPARIRSSALFSWLPDKLMDKLLRVLTLPVTRKITSTGEISMKDKSNRNQVQAAINNQAEHFDMLGAELGYVYHHGCAVDPSATSTPDNSVRTYIPLAAPGARLPHVEITLNGKKQSTLDLVSYSAYTLITNGEHQKTTFETFGLPLQGVDIQKLGNIDALTKSLDLDAGAWILVRPDGHVAARSKIAN